MDVTTTLPVCRWCKTNENVRISKGPGRQVGALARSFMGTFAPIPDDYEFPYCSKCNCRILTKEQEEKILGFEQDYLRTSDPPDPNAPRMPKDADVSLDFTCSICKKPLHGDDPCLR